MKKYVRGILLLFFSLVILFFVSCNDPVTTENSSLNLSIIECTSIEAWLSLRTENIPLPALINVSINSIIKKYNISSIDTILYIDSLLPGTTYIVETITNSKKSNKLSFRTLDITPNNYTSQTWTFGEHSNSSFTGCAIISENDIWCVGSVFMNDSLGVPDPHIYNAAHWDGYKWELKRLIYKYEGQTGLSPIETVNAFASDDIWFGVAGFIHLDGDTFYSVKNTFSSLVNACWGLTSNNFYIIGNNGNVMNYKDGNWVEINCGTTKNLYDICGVIDGKGGINKYIIAENEIIKLDENNKVVNMDAFLKQNYFSIWAKSERLIYAAGALGLSVLKNNSHQDINIFGSDKIYFIKGQEYNDIAALTTAHSIYHFNGLSWQLIYNNPNYTYRELTIKNNLIVAVGWQDRKAVITILRSN